MEAPPTRHPKPGSAPSQTRGRLANAEPAFFRELDEERPAGRDVHLFLELPPPARAFRRAFRLPVGQRHLDEPATRRHRQLLVTEGRAVVAESPGAIAALEAHPPIHGHRELGVHAAARLRELRAGRAHGPRKLVDLLLRARVTDRKSTRLNS